MVQSPLQDREVIVLTVSLHELMDRARDLHRRAVMEIDGRPVGTVAARDPEAPALNYDQCFTRDFAVSAVAFLLDGETEIVRNFLLETVALQIREKGMECFDPGQGLMPASFRLESGAGALAADFGDQAIARVAPVDAGFWWLFILRSYVRATGEIDLAHRPGFQNAIRLILDLCLPPRFEMFPTLLVPDASFMIDRRMGVYGHPIDIQALFFIALRTCAELLADTPENRPYLRAVRSRMSHLALHVREHYWLDLAGLNRIYRYYTDEYGSGASNTFNINPASIPAWLTEWMPEEGGYFAGNLGPGRMDFRFFSMGNLLAVLSSLADDEMAAGVMTTFSRRFDDLVAAMPVKMIFPALDGEEWRIMTGCDPKNMAWSYHNGGSWPFLSWLLVAAALRAGREEMAEKTLELLAARIDRDEWPEYYDGINGRLIGRRARRFQTWTIAGFLAAALLAESPERLELIGFSREEYDLACPL